jgi:hypothetical protein
MRNANPLFADGGALQLVAEAEGPATLAYGVSCDQIKSIQGRTALQKEGVSKTALGGK